MKAKLKRSAAASTILLLVLLGLQQVAPHLPENGALGMVRIAVAQARGRNPLWWDGLWKASNGYYENLIGGDDPAAGQTLITRILRGRLPWNMTSTDHKVYDETGFLLWKAKPNLHFIDLREGPTRTNSYGYFDTQHSLQKPAGVRRVAVLGDSITRGWGVHLDQRFSNLLEQRLNSEVSQPIEMINFSMPGYRLTQIYDVALEQVPAFHPDVYMVVLTDLCMTPRWGSQIITLVEKSEDLKYDFLRQIVKESGLQKGDSPSLADWKLGPYRIPASRDILLRLKAHTEKEHAKLLVVLVPAAEDGYVVRRHFKGVHAALDGTGIPVVDLMDAFDDTDVEAARTEWYDAHPGEIGHRLIADELYRALHQDSQAWMALTGASGAIPPARPQKVTDNHRAKALRRPTA